MKARTRRHRARGFTLIEMMVSMAIFLLICGSAFTLLGVSQQRYQSDTQVLNSFQEARLGLDQILRDVNDSGYPPPNQFELPLPNPSSSFADTPVAWSPNYLSSPPVPCLMSVVCTTPNSNELIIETNPTPQVAGSKVQYIRYRLFQNILYRSMVDKTGQDPTGNGSNTWTNAVPFVQNVMNNAPAAQMAQINVAYPNMFPGGNPVPVFQYTCDTLSGPQDCSAAGSSGIPTNIRSVTVTLIVQTPTPDLQTGQLRIVELTGRGSRINSFQ
jgi:prepilin-type N-terminal cleavage/methylation domain-containing protein